MDSAELGSLESGGGGSVGEGGGRQTRANTLSLPIGFPNEILLKCSSKTVGRSSTSRALQRVQRPCADLQGARFLLQKR